MAETWVINETLGSTSLLASTVNVNFTSNNQNFISITGRSGGRPVSGTVILKYGNTNVNVYVDGSANDWIDQAYRTVTFETAPTGDLLTWLQANAEKQEDPPTETKNIKIGQATPSGLFIGEDEVDAVYVGSTKVWEKTEEPSGYNVVLNISFGDAVNGFVSIDDGEYIMMTSGTKTFEDVHKIVIDSDISLRISNSTGDFVNGEYGNDPYTTILTQDSSCSVLYYD